MTEQKRNAVYSKHTVELVTVAAEFCAFLEQSAQRTGAELADTVLKLLPLLYLKASMVPPAEETEDFYAETFVTEQDYEMLRVMLAGVLGEHDDYLDLYDDRVKFNDEAQMHTLSEDLADIYQVLKNFVQRYRSGMEEIMYEAVAEVTGAFTLYWGQTLCNALRALHRVRYTESFDEGDAAWE